MKKFRVGSKHGLRMSTITDYKLAINTSECDKSEYNNRALEKSKKEIRLQICS